MKKQLLFLGIVCILSFPSCVSDTGSQQNDNITQTAGLSLIGDDLADNLAPFNFDGTLGLSTSFDNGLYLSGSDSEFVYLLVKVMGALDNSSDTRTPLNIAVVIDQSGSMQYEGKLEYAKNACKLIIENLSARDKLSVIAYHDDITILQESSFLTDKMTLRVKVDGLRPDKSTNLSGGMLEGYSQVESSYEDNMVNRVLLLTDGLANKGITDRTQLQEIVHKKYAKKGIAISTFGIGADFNEDLLTNLAEHGRGNYYFIASADEIPQIFAKELDGLLSVVAQNTRIAIDFPSDYFKVEKVYGYEYTVSKNVIKIEYNDVFSEEEKTVLIKLAVKKTIDKEQPFHVSLTYDDVMSGYDRVTEESDLVLRLTQDLAYYKEGFNAEVQRNIIMFRATEIFEMAALQVDQGNYSIARDLIQSNISYMDRGFRMTKPDSAMIKQHHLNTVYFTDIDNIESKSKAEIKMMQKSGKRDNYYLKKKKF